MAGVGGHVDLIKLVFFASNLFAAETITNEPC